MINSRITLAMLSIMLAKPWPTRNTGQLGQLGQLEATYEGDSKTQKILLASLVVLCRSPFACAYARVRARERYFLTRYTVVCLIGIQIMLLGGLETIGCHNVMCNNTYGSSQATPWD